MKLVVIGGGAAGFFCAVNAARMNPSLQVIILEKTVKLLTKVKVSGGGRCNVTHDCNDISEMASHYPRGRNFVKKSFHEFFTTDTIQWFSERGLPLKAESDGRIFPVTDNSQSVIDCLMNEVETYNVEIRLQVSVDSVQKNDDGFVLQVKASGRQEQINTDLICIATGGSSKLEGFEWIRLLGHKIIPPVPSLFTFNVPGHPINSLMGVSVENAEVRIPQIKEKQQGPLLITHWGLSGPVILKLSAWCAVELAEVKYEFLIAVNWVPEYHETDMRNFLVEYRTSQGSLQVRNKNPFRLAQRSWDFLLQNSGIGEETRWSDLPAASLNRLVKNLCSYEMTVSGKIGRASCRERV